MPETWDFSKSGAHAVPWTWISLVVLGLASASSRMSTEQGSSLGFWQFALSFPTWESSARVIPKLHFHMHITSSVSFEG